MKCIFIQKKCCGASVHKRIKTPPTLWIELINIYIRSKCGDIYILSSAHPPSHTQSTHNPSGHAGTNRYYPAHTEATNSVLLSVNVNLLYPNINTITDTFWPLLCPLKTWFYHPVLLIDIMKQAGTSDMWSLLYCLLLHHVQG